MGTIAQNTKLGIRQLRRNPGFTATVVLTLALAIGANTAVFSIVNVLLLKSLPYPHPERIGTIYTRIQGTRVSDERHKLNGEQWQLLRDGVPALLSAVARPRSSGVNFQSLSHLQYVQDGSVSAHYMDVLGIEPALGRNFSQDEDRPHGPNLAILSYNLWRKTFNSNPHVLGQDVLLRGESYTVIGVLPEGAVTPLNADLYTPLRASREGEGRGTNFESITRLRDGATWQEADAEINRAWLNRSERYEQRDNPGAQVTYHSVPLQQALTDPLRPQVLALMLAAGFIVLIACANLGGLTLVRVLRRSSEVAARLALGASSWQIQKQFWIENLILASMGGAAGIGLAFLSLRTFLHLVPEHFLPVRHVTLDFPALAFTALVSLLTSVLFGMFPALAARQIDLRSSMLPRGVAPSGRLRLRQGLIAGEVALTVVLLAACGLLIRTLVYLQTLPPGFNPNGVLVAKASLDDSRFHDPAAFRKLLDQSTAAMRSIPGVEEAAFGQSLPYERSAINGALALNDGKDAGQQVEADEVYITPSYFRALQIPVVLGRAFTDQDGPNSKSVAVINRTFMRKFFHGESPIGRHIDNGRMIVGVVEDVPVPPGMDTAPLSGEQTMYIPAAQANPQLLAMSFAWFQPNWIVRTAGPVQGLTAQMQQALASVDPNLPFSGFYRVRDLVAKTLAMQRMKVALLGTMAGLALLLSAVGIFALAADAVTQRMHEIGVRMALGSTVAQAMVEIGCSGAGASMAGLCVGLILCAATLGLMRSELYGIKVYDVPTILAVIVILISVAFFATSVPVLRIARIDPAQTLRDE
jgi:putative ABC transport system permease protein